jgi:tRNA nucleotidyltransferase (CCA-adding enzyme)
MNKEVKIILNQILEKIEPPIKDLEFIEEELKKFLKKLKLKIKFLKIDAEIFIGGSYAKKTLIKKNKYDIDLFLRFDKKYKGNISELTFKILEDFKKVLLIHGSRDYFNVEISPFAFFEIVPVLKINNYRMVENITDLSYFHVKYINKKIKNKKILDDIKIAKAFCYANNCYGAESYIRGLSGYSLELIVYYYGGFFKFIKSIAKSKSNEKIIIDIEKQYRSKSLILLDINESKLKSPIILIDPTYKQRNTFAALSDETFERFKKICQDFLKNPSIKFFEEKKIDLEEIKNNAKKNRLEFVLIEARTIKQKGDVAGSKLLKFYKHFEEEFSRFFDIKNKGFNYNGNKSARSFFVVKPKKEILIKGPFVGDDKNIKKFKKKHKITFVKNKKINTKQKIDFTLKEFFNHWKKKNNRKIKEMYVEKLELK